jgi:transcriptional regulator with XRE-family HTH domain
LRKTEVSDVGARTDPRVIAAIRFLLRPNDESLLAELASLLGVPKDQLEIGTPLRRTRSIIREVQALGLGTPSEEIIQREAYRFDIELETGPIAGSPGIGRPRESKDKKPRQPRSDRGQRRGASGSVDDLASRARTSYAVTKSYRETARKLGVSAEYIRKLLKRDRTDDNK